MNKRLIGRIIAISLFTLLLLSTILSAISSYNLYLKNVTRNLDLSIVIFFGFVSFFCLSFNLTKILPSRFYRKPLHTFLRFADLLGVGILSIYISSGILHFFYRISKKSVESKDLFFLLIFILTILATVFLIKDNFYYQKEIKKKLNYNVN